VETPRLVRVSKLRGTDNNSSVKDSAVGPTERYFHSEPAILPLFVQMSLLGAAEDENPRFQKAAQYAHSSKFLFRARKRRVARFQLQAATTRFLALAITGGASGATVAGIVIADDDKKKCVSSSRDKKCKCTKDKHGKEVCEE